MAREKRPMKTLCGDGRLDVAGESYPVAYEIRIYQEFNEGVPCLKSASGALDFPELGMVCVKHGAEEMTLHFIEGTARIFLTDNGRFRVKGGIAES